MEEERETPTIVLQETENKTPQKPTFKNIINVVSSRGPEQRTIFLTSVLLVIFFAVLIVESVIGRSTEFVPIAFIELMHFMLFTVIFITDYYSTLPSDEFHTYGYARTMVVCCFAVSLIVILFACSLLLEALKNFLASDAPDASLSVTHPSFTPISPHLFALVIYLFVMFRFRHYSAKPNHSKTPHFHAAFLVALSGAAHSISHIVEAVIPFSSFSESVTEQVVPLFHGLVALFIIDQSKAILFPSFLVLMQATPEKLLEVTDRQVGETYADKLVRDVSNIEGVVECKSPHFWGLTFTEYVGSLHIRTKNNANDQHIIAQAHEKLDPIVPHFTVQVEKDHWDTSVRNN